MKKLIDPKEIDSLKLLSERKYQEIDGFYHTPYLKDQKIPDDEWKAMEYLALYRGYQFKNKKI